jgi:hypothetical protein
MNKFYTFSQNNSGGSFDYQPNDGITHYVIIEASNETEANSRAETIGLYFNGCDSEMDCPCCGDRWYVVDASDGKGAPLIYGKPPTDYNDPWFSNDFPRGSVCVHYLDGRKEWMVTA